jgi:hypothetical protein
MDGQQLEIYDMVKSHNERAQNLTNERAVLETPKPISSKKRIEQVLFAQGHITNAEAAELLRYSKGQLSFGQRLRDIRKDLRSQGKELDCIAIGDGVFDYVVRN